MRIFKWDRFNDIVEKRINKIDRSDFLNMLENCYDYEDNVLYKKIYQSDFDYGIFEKSLKLNENINSSTHLLDDTYPNVNYSLVCNSKELDDYSDIDTYVVLPFKESLFTIEDKNGNKHYKGYWKDKIKWLDKYNENKVWTESKCLLIKKDIWDSLFEEEKRDDYTSRDVIATTLIGETGGDQKDAPMVLSVLKNRAKKRKSSLEKEALRKWQFSMWNKHYTKNVPIKDIIDSYKKNNNWQKKHWDYVYSLVDKKDQISDKVKGSTMYYAHKKVLPYWADNNSKKMKELGKEWKPLVKSSLHTYGIII